MDVSVLQQLEVRGAGSLSLSNPLIISSVSSRTRQQLFFELGQFLANCIHIFVYQNPSSGRPPYQTRKSFQNKKSCEISSGLIRFRLFFLQVASNIKAGSVWINNHNVFDAATGNSKNDVHSFFYKQLHFRPPEPQISRKS